MQKELRILILENSEEETNKVLQTLKDSNLVFKATRTSCGAEVGNKLDAFHPDIILASHSETINAIDALEECLRRKSDARLIIVSEGISEQFAVEALRRGAFDYIIKPDLT